MKALSMRIAGLALLAILLATLLLDRLFPVSALVERQGVSQTVLDRSGLPLRAFPNRAGLWRWSMPLEDIDEQYIETLLAYEDRYFWHHPGVNPLSLARALYQCILAGRVVSGGSTLTMQVARLLDPHRRSLGGKLKQMLRALQLEAHYSKREILQLYVDLAPFGGILQGVGAASYAYLGKPPTELSVAEAALLTVLPQRPSRLRLDRHPAQAQKARDKVLNRLHKRGLISEAVWQQAKLERVALAPTLRLPMEAPLASRRLTVEMPGQPMIRSTLDGPLAERHGLDIAGCHQPLAHPYLARRPDRPQPHWTGVGLSGFRRLPPTGAIRPCGHDQRGALTRFHAQALCLWPGPGTRTGTFTFAVAGCAHELSRLSPGELPARLSAVPRP